MSLKHLATRSGRPISHLAVVFIVWSVVLGTTSAVNGAEAVALGGANSVSTAQQPGAEKPVGVDLGNYLIRAYYSVEGRKGKVRFTLHATVAAQDVEEFERLLANRENKVRDQVLIATRLVPLADFDDPELTDFRRRILLRLQRSLPELAMNDIYVSDFELTVDAM